MVQILGGLITYLLLAIYCKENFNEKVNIERVRKLRTQIQNEIRDASPRKNWTSRRRKRRKFYRAKT